MAVPPKRRSNRSRRRADQRSSEAPDEQVTNEHVTEAVAEGVPRAFDPATVPGDGTQQWITAPPRATCPPWHYYWCDGHDDWHHHTEAAVGAIAASFPQP